MSELEKLARQYVAENRLTLGEQLALSVFVARAKQLLVEPRERDSNVEPMGVVDEARGWRLV